MLGLLILLVSFEKKTIMARDRILTITGDHLVSAVFFFTAIV
jgi:hypothetical protein